MREYLPKLILVFILICEGTYLQARQPYHALVVVDDTSATVSAPNLVDLTRDLRSTSIELLIPSYTPVTPVSIGINLRGINVITFFPANSTTLFIAIPQAGTTTTFTGSTREESLLLFKDFIRDAGNSHRLLRAYAKYSPIDPIAGNPNSLMAQMASADYLTGQLSPFSGCTGKSQPIPHLYQLGAYSGRAFSGGFDTSIVTIPLRYSYSPNLDWAFILDAPLAYIRNGGASSIIGSLGFGLKYPVTCKWSLTPILRAGSGGSLDLCTSGTFVSGGLISVYNWKINKFALTMTNYAGGITSTNLWLTGINFNYRLHNYMFKNGLSLTSCDGFNLCKVPLNLSISFADTYFTSNKFYINHYDEVGVTLIANRYNCLSIGFVYQFGKEDYKGYSLNLGYQF